MRKGWRPADLDCPYLALLTGDLSWNIVYRTNGVALEILTPYTSDFDGNGMVDGNDLGFWKNALALFDHDELITTRPMPMVMAIPTKVISLLGSCKLVAEWEYLPLLFQNRGHYSWE